MATEKADDKGRPGADGWWRREAARMIRNNKAVFDELVNR